MATAVTAMQPRPFKCKWCKFNSGTYSGLVRHRDRQHQNNLQNASSSDEESGVSGDIEAQKSGVSVDTEEQRSGVSANDEQI